jgi:cytochrome c-type biogenesis protein CcmH
MRRFAAAVLAVLSIAAAPGALPDAQEEARARALFREIRCVVCQNESIEASPADIAADLRTVVREQVAAGRSDAQIREFLVQRYGEFVLFRPAWTLGNALLWLTPFAVVGLGVAVIALRARSRRVRAGAAAPETLAADGARDAATEPWSPAEPHERNVT